MILSWLKSIHVSIEISTRVSTVLQTKGPDSLPCYLTKLAFWCSAFSGDVSAMIWGPLFDLQRQQGW